MWEPFARPLTSERRLSTASDIAGEDIGSQIHHYFQESQPCRAAASPSMKMTVPPWARGDYRGVQFSLAPTSP